MITQETALQISESLNEPAWLRSRRQAALSPFLALPMPSFRYGIAISFDLRQIMLEQLSPKVQDGDTDMIIADTGIIALPFTEALASHEQLIKEHLLALFPQTDKFAALHAVAFTNGIFVYAPQHIQGTVELRLAASGTKIENILVIAEPGSKVTIIEHANAAPAAFRSQLVEVFAREHAQVNYITVQNVSAEAYSFASRKARVEMNAAVHWAECILGGRFAKSTTSTLLAAEGAQSTLNSAFFGNSNKNFDLYGEVIHAAPHTTSDMLVKGAVNDYAKTIFRGLIRINPGAYASNGYQKEEVLLLAETAEADAVPNLEIQNNDVRCSHGTTISQIDAEKLFYLMSRGMPEHAAKQLLIEGFFHPLLQKIGNSTIQDEIHHVIMERLGEVK
ncbi:Fe-S cluster assembly protein SufD [Candidatus Woesearchaeota archaeon]|nr:Fe-S cluster assembly protein SufD [Candidatus Woesearchaeota archaeon]